MYLLVSRKFWTALILAFIMFLPVEAAADGNLESLLEKARSTLQNTIHMGKPRKSKRTKSRRIRSKKSHRKRAKKTHRKRAKKTHRKRSKKTHRKHTRKNRRSRTRHSKRRSELQQLHFRNFAVMKKTASVEKNA